MSQSDNDVKISEVQQSQPRSCSSQGKWSLQHVFQQSSRPKVVAWILKTLEKDGPKNLNSKTIWRFPERLKENMKANLEKESDWWRKRVQILQKSRANPRYVSSCQEPIRRQEHTKATSGRPIREETGPSGYTSSLKKSLRDSDRQEWSSTISFFPLLQKILVKSCED